ncbi:HipA family kinase [Agarivorans aestuarii]|uniref:HipA family kinase n=1 Tax=Agarivorans aestuarii TaxID=1563703 RepID=UPI001C7EB7F4|nr:HipA family kinase [Agarivorans aestuarii]
MEEIEIIHVIKTMEQGRTQPYLCEAEDGNQYILKGTSATYKGLIKECIAAELGIEFGLPIPKFRLAYIDENFARYSIIDTECEYGFASSYQQHIQDIKYYQLAQLEPQILRDLYFFDYWIKNGDRCLTELGGNPNFFIHQKTGEPIVIDHNLAFDVDFSIDEHIFSHVGRDAWGGLQLIDNVQYRDKCRRALDKLPAVVDQLPQEWLELYPLDRIEEEITLVLHRYEHADFWEDIR